MPKYVENLREALNDKGWSLRNGSKWKQPEDVFGGDLQFTNDVEKVRERVLHNVEAKWMNLDYEVISLCFPKDVQA